MKMLRAKFIKIPMPCENDIEQTTQEELNKVFKNMLGHTYNIILSEFNNEYVILGGTTEEAEKEFQESIYKSLIQLGEDKEYARKVATGEEDPDGCMYFPEYCFKIVKQQEQRTENPLGEKGER